MSDKKDVAVAISIGVFEAFPGAVVAGRYSIGKYQRGTVEGNQFTNLGNLDVIVDEADAGDIGMAPNAETIDADLLMYCKPEQLPTTNARALTAGYMIYDAEYDDYFAIINAGVGKNQDRGEIEHIELLLRQTEVING